MSYVVLKCSCICEQIREDTIFLIYNKNNSFLENILEPTNNKGMYVSRSYVFLQKKIVLQGILIIGKATLGNKFILILLLFLIISNEMNDIVCRRFP